MQRRGRSTSEPITRVVSGFVTLGVVFVTAVSGFRFFHDLNWLESTWITVMAVSTIGFSEESVKSPAFQLYTLVVVLFGLSASAYAFTGIVQLLLAGEVDRVLGRRRMKRDISKLNNHVLICGYGRLGVSLASDLSEENHPFVVIEVDAASGQQAIDEGYHVVIGDATEEEVLREAGLQSAKSVVTALPSDAANVFITLTARNLNQSVQIIARAEQPSTKRKLEQAGANKIVMPATNSARHMQRMITRPSTAHLIELMSERTYLDLEMDELLVPEESSLVGITVRMTEAHRMHRLLVVAVRRADQSMVFNPEADYTFAVGDVAILMGTRGDIEAFCKRYKLLT